MSNIPLKSITFPGLGNTYTIPEIDTTLSVTGKAADSKKTGDEISQLKADLDDVNGRLAQLNDGSELKALGPFTTGFLDFAVTTGDVLVIANNSSTGYIQCSLNTGKPGTVVQNFGSISMNSVVMVTANVDAPIFRVWFPANIAKNDTVLVMKNTSLFSKVITGMKEKVSASQIVDAFSSSDSYEYGDYVLSPDGNICKLTNYVNGEWSVNKALQVTTMNEMASAIKNLRSSIGDCHRYALNLPSYMTGIREYWNTYIPKEIPAGTLCYSKLLSYTGDKLNDCVIKLRIKGTTTYENLMVHRQVGSELFAVTRKEYDEILIQFKRSESEWDVDAIIDWKSTSETGLFSNIIDLETANGGEETFTLIKGTNAAVHPLIFLKKGEQALFTETLETTGSGAKSVQVTYYKADGTTGTVKVFYNSAETYLFTAPEDVYGLNIYLNSTDTITAATATVNVIYGKEYVKSKIFDAETSINSLTDKVNSLVVPHRYTCMKDGSGDFDSLATAIRTVCEEMDATLYVGPGEWDLISELGADYLNTIGSANRGLYLKNRVHVICSSDALITCHYTGDRADTITWLSAFNAGPHGFTLENAHIESSNCRYTIHDERDTSTDHYDNVYINCIMKHDNTNGGFRQVIGGGLGYDGHIIIDGCIFENPNAMGSSIVSYHNTWYAGGDGKSVVEVKGSYFKGTGTFRGSWFGASQDITTFLIHGNSLGSAIQHVVENQSYMDDNPTWIKNTEMFEWNNVIRST